MKRSNSGTAFSEYTLCLVVLVAVSGLIGVLSNFPKLVNQYFQRSNYGNVENNSLKIHALGYTTTPTLPLSASTPKTANPTSNQSSQNSQVCLKSGICVSIPTINGGTVTDTTGGLGTSLIAELSDSLTQLAEQLKEVGADKTLINLVIKLALSGHQMGSNIDNLVSVCASGGKICDQAQSQNAAPGITWKGGGNSTHGHSDHNNFNAYPDSSQFQNIKQQLDEYFSAHPGQYGDISGIVDMESSQILNIVNGIQIVQTQIASNGVVRGASLTKVDNSATLIHMDSNTICTSGGNQNICIQTPSSNIDQSNPAPGT